MPFETPLNNEYTLQKEGHDCKTDPAKGWVVAGGGEYVEGIEECAYAQ
jgi:hypothetical protein